MSYFQNLRNQADAEQAAQIAATQNAPNEKEPVRLSFDCGEFWYRDGQKDITGKLGEDRDDHIDRLIARANEVAKERRVKLIISTCGNAVVDECKDYR